MVRGSAILHWKYSRGRTVRQTILGGYGFGVGSTLVSFIILGNYSMGKQISGAIDFISQYNENGDLYHLIVSMIKNHAMCTADYGCCISWRWLHFMQHRSTRSH